MIEAIRTGGDEEHQRCVDVGDGANLHHDRIAEDECGGEKSGAPLLGPFHQHSREQHDLSYRDEMHRGIAEEEKDRHAEELVQLGKDWKANIAEEVNRAALRDRADEGEVVEGFVKRDRGVEGE